MPSKPKARHVPCSDEQYHRRTEWSHSQSEVPRDPDGNLTRWAYFHGRHISHTFERAPTKATDQGSVVHSCLLHPQGFDGVCAIIPAEVLNEQGHRKGKKYQEWRRDRLSLIDLKPEEAQPAFLMSQNARKHPDAARLLDTATHREYTIVWRDAKTGLPLRCRLDLLSSHLDGYILADVKTTRRIQPRQFASDMAGFGYHRQLAWYREGAEALGLPIYGCAIIAIHTSPAYECAVYEIPEHAIDLGEEENHAFLKELKRRLEADDWSDNLSAQSYMLDLPRWAYLKDPWRIA